MHPSLRSLLIWLMALALPIQAVAAAGMQHCGAVHRLMQVGSAAAVAAGGHDAAHAATPHPHADADTGLAVTPGDPSNDGSNASALDDGSRCSACANCCSALALPASPVRLPAPAIEARAAALPASDVVSFMPGGIDRPPRTVLA